MNIAIIGVSTLAGENLFEILEASELPVEQLFLLDNDDEVGRTLMFKGHSVRIRGLEAFAFEQVALAFVCDPAFSVQQLQPARAAGVQLIDLFPARFGADAALVIPEVNPQVVDEVEAGRVLGSPSAAAVASALALAPLQQQYQLLRLHLVVMQSAAELGRPGVEALAAETTRLLNGRDPEAGYLPAQFAFNLIPQSGQVQKDGYTDSELRLIDEVRELLGDEQIEVLSSVVQLPIFYGVSVLVQAETQQAIELDEAERVLRAQPGLALAQGGEVCTPVNTAAGSDNVHLSRFRLEPGNASGFALCAVTDNLRKGSALNAVQIAQLWMEKRAL